MDGPLAPGKVLAGRFRIVRAVGRGGMGTVYEAVDETLDRRVAIKCARPGHQLSLPPEARTAREVSHYNVCKVYDLHTVAWEGRVLSFLSMEFVEGETLSERLSQQGPLKGRAALEVVRQVCEGLEQAHRQGVIHGDLKSANVILADGKDGAVRAVLTDFGLARFAEADGSKVRSRQGGTPGYMAPEQLRGGAATIASDVFALGVLLHVVLAGRMPLRRTGKESLSPEASTGTMAAAGEPGDWHYEVQGLPRPWNGVIRKCLRREPAERYGSAAEVWEALRPRRWILKSVAATLALLAVGLAYWQGRVETTAPVVRLAVLPMGNATVVGMEIAERLSGARRNFSVISPQEAQPNRVDSLEKARTVFGATHALETRVQEVGGKMEAEARLVELSSGQALRELKAEYEAGDTATLAKALVGTVSVGLGLPPALVRETVADAAYPVYARGLAVLRQDPLRAAEAVALLEEAVEIDRRSPLPLAELAGAQVQRFRNGDGSEWLEKAERSVNQAAGINPDALPVLLSTGLVDQLKGRYEQAVAVFKRAAEMEGSSPSAMRLLAEAYHAAGQEEVAIETYRRAIAAEPGSYGPYLYFGNYHLMRGNWVNAEQMYREATQRAPGLASGHMNLGLALKQQGRYAESEKALEHFEASARMSAATAALQRNLGDAQRQLGQGKEAKAAYQRAREMSEQDLRLNPRSAVARARLALVTARLGDKSRAEFELSQALRLENAPVGARVDVVQTWEVLGERAQALKVLNGATPALLEEVARQPDLKELRRDPRFLEMLKRK